MGRIAHEGENLLALAFDVLEMGDLGVEFLQIGGHLVQEIGVAFGEQRM